MYKCSSMPLNSIKAPMSFLTSNFENFPSYVIILSLFLFSFQKSDVGIPVQMTNVR